MNITCGACGHAASLEAFTERPVSGTLPPGRFQCPKCGYAFERRASGGWKTYKSPNGAVMHVPDRIELVPVAAVL